LNLFTHFIVQIDATDAVITDKGFNYLQECKSIESLKLNFNDYFGDEGLLQLSHGRIPRTLRKMVNIKKYLR